LYDRRCGGFNNGGSRRFNNGFFSGRLSSLIGRLLGRRLLGGLFFFDRSDLTNETSGFGFALEHRYECFNQS
jgi:hypothetical protein